MKPSRLTMRNAHAHYGMALLVRKSRPASGPRPPGPRPRLRSQPDRRRSAPRWSARGSASEALWTTSTAWSKPRPPTASTTPPAPSRSSRKRPPTRACISHAIDLLAAGPQGRLPRPGSRRRPRPETAPLIPPLRRVDDQRSSSRSGFQPDVLPMKRSLTAPCIARED